MGLRPPLPFPLGMVPPTPGLNINMNLAMPGMPPFIHPAAMRYVIVIRITDLYLKKTFMMTSLLEKKAEKMG